METSRLQDACGLKSNCVAVCMLLINVTCSWCSHSTTTALASPATTLFAGTQIKPSTVTTDPTEALTVLVMCRICCGPQARSKTSSVRHTTHYDAILRTPHHTQCHHRPFSIGVLLGWSCCSMTTRSKHNSLRYSTAPERCCQPPASCNHRLLHRT